MTTLAASRDRLARSIGRMLSAHEFEAEVPFRIHTKDPDDGHGLGGHAFAPEFLAYLKAAGVCLCEFERGPDHDFGCERDTRPARYRESNRRSNPRRLRRALRQLRALDPASFDLVYLMLGRGLTYRGACTRLNEGRFAAGQEPYTEAECAVLALAGFDLLAAAF